MASLNKVLLMGNLGADPEIRFTPGGSAVANFRIATTEVWNDKQSGERKEKTEWHRIVVWGKQAEHCGEYLKKGRAVFVEGRLETREWQDKDGNKRWTTEVKADRVTFIGSGRGEGAYEPRGGGSSGGGGYEPRASRGGDEQRERPSGSSSGGYHDDPPPLGDDDIPF